MCSKEINNTKEEFVKGNGLKFGMYMRVANKEITREDSQIETQRKILNQYLKNVNNVISKKYYIDNGVSGVTFNRPELKRMIKDVKNNEVNTIIVKDLTRFGRGSNTYGKIIDLMNKYDVNFIAIDNDINTITDKNSFLDMANILKIFKEMEMDRIIRNQNFKKNSVNKREDNER